MCQREQRYYSGFKIQQCLNLLASNHFITSGGLRPLDWSKQTAAGETDKVGQAPGLQSPPQGTAGGGPAWNLGFILSDWDTAGFEKGH